MIAAVQPPSSGVSPARVFEFVVAALLLLGAIRSLVTWFRTDFDAVSAGERVLFAVHASARVGTWLAFAAVFLFANLVSTSLTVLLALRRSAVRLVGGRVFWRSMLRIGVVLGAAGIDPPFDSTVEPGHEEVPPAGPRALEQEAPAIGRPGRVPVEGVARGDAPLPRAVGSDHPHVIVPRAVALVGQRRSVG